MADHAHKLEIFRGLIKFKSNTQKIIGVLILLSIVTLIEVVLGIYKPAILNEYFLNLKLLNWIFIILTLITLTVVISVASKTSLDFSDGALQEDFGWENDEDEENLDDIEEDY